MGLERRGKVQGGHDLLISARSCYSGLGTYQSYSFSARTKTEAEKISHGRYLRVASLHGIHDHARGNDVFGGIALVNSCWAGIWVLFVSQGRSATQTIARARSSHYGKPIAN